MTGGQVEGADPGATSLASRPAPLWRSPAMRRLVLLSVLGFSSFCLTLAALPLWAVAGGASEGAAGLVTTVMLAATVATQAGVPAIVARLGAGRSLAAGLLALGAPAPLLAVSGHLAPLLAVSAVRGVGFALLTVIGATLTAAVAPPERHGESVGLYGLSIAIPNLVGIPAGVALTQAGGFAWVAALSVAPVLAVPLALSLGRRAEDAAPGAEPGESPAGHRAAVRAAVPPSVVLLVVTLAGGGMVTFLPIERRSGPLATAALLLFGAVAALGRWRAGILADRMARGSGSRWLLAASLGCAVIGLGLVSGGLVAGRGADVAVLAGAAVFGAGYGAVQNLTLLHAFAGAGAGRTATASAVWNAAFDAGTGAGASLVGGVAALGLGLPRSFGLTALLMAATLPVAFTLARPRQDRARA